LVRAAATQLLKNVRLNRPFGNVPEPEIQLPEQPAGQTGGPRFKAGVMA
jgi:hypothetical protein